MNDTPLELDMHRIIVLDQPVIRSINQAGYDYVNKYISLEEDLIHRPGCRFMALWSPNTEISCSAAESSMKSVRAIIGEKTFQGNPGTIEELSAYETLFYDSLGDTVIAALGEEIIVSKTNKRYYAYRNLGGSERELRLGNRAKPCPKGFCFLIVFDEAAPDKM